MSKISNLLSTGLALMAAAGLQAQNKGVEGSPHDLSQATWNSRKGVCSPCHQAHNTDPAQLAPLWAHATSTAAFTPYDSPSMDAAVGTPKGVSLSCLSCHDGTVAINQGIGGPIGSPPEMIDDGARIGPDLHTTHPISFTYDAALASKDGGLENPETYKIGDPKTGLTISTPPVPPTWSGTSLTGKTIKEAMLKGDQMECSSCHDVHKLIGSAPTSGIMAKLSGTDSGTPTRGSLLCRTCHIK